MSTSNGDIKVAINITEGNITSFKIIVSNSSKKNTGGLCGFWNDDPNDDLFILNNDGIEVLENDTANLTEFWK
jgi:hypothetical protein